MVLASAGVASFLSGFLGIGGALVLTPLLLYLPPLVGAPSLGVKLVTGLTIVQALSGSLFAARRHRGYGYVSMRAVRIMGPAMGAASLVGALVSSAASDRLLLAIFAGLALMGAVALLFPPRQREGTESGFSIDAPIAIATATAVGFVSGMVGIGGIWLVVPALIHLLHLPTRDAIGTALAIGFFGALAGVVGKAATAQIDPYLGVLVFASAAVVAPLGAMASVRTRPRALTTSLAAVVVAAAARVAWSALTGV